MMTPRKKENKHRVTVYLSDSNYDNLTSHVTMNYTAMNSYGAISDTVNSAMTSYFMSCQQYSNQDIQTPLERKLEEVNEDEEET